MIRVSRIQVNSINRLLGNSSNTHYSVMLVNNDTTIEFEHAVDDLERRYNIKCICITKDELIPLLKQLNTRIREKKVFISGAYDDVPDSVVNASDLLSHALVTALLSNEYRISTGVGKRLGTLVTGYAYQYLAEHEIQNKIKYLSMRPFPFHLNLSEETKEKYRTIMQNDCSAAIFLFGQSKGTSNLGSFDKTGHYSHGVYQEFQIAKQRNLTIIPVGSTGYESKVIWNEVNSEINRFFYLSGKMDALMNEQNPELISKIILQILADVAQYRRTNQQ